MTDEELFTRYRRGDEAAFHELFHRYWEPLQELLRSRRGARQEDAEDVAIEALNLASCKAATFDPERGAEQGRFARWLRRSPSTAGLPSAKCVAGGLRPF